MWLIGGIVWWAWVLWVLLMGWLAYKALFDRRPLKNCEGCHFCCAGKCVNIEARNCMEYHRIAAGEIMCPWRRA